MPLVPWLSTTGDCWLLLQTRKPKQTTREHVRNVMTPKPTSPKKTKSGPSVLKPFDSKSLKLLTALTILRAHRRDTKLSATKATHRQAKHTRTALNCAKTSFTCKIKTSLENHGKAFLKNDFPKQFPQTGRAFFQTLQKSFFFSHIFQNTDPKLGITGKPYDPPNKLITKL